jgi:Ca2+-binding RTX toxin-like protein
MPDISGTDQGETITGTSGPDTIYALGGNDTVNAGADQDWLHGGSGDDTLNAGDGNDALDGEGGIDILNGGDGDDTLWAVVSATQATTVDSGDRYNGDAGHDRLILYGSLYDQTASFVTLGTQLVVSGIEELISDNRAGVAGTIAQFSAFQLVHLAAIRLTDGTSFTPGADFRAREWHLPDTGFTLDLSQGGATASIIKGGVGNDTIHGPIAVWPNDQPYQEPVVYYGEGGNDTMHGNAWMDSFIGGTGDDIAYGHAGNDRFVEGAGNDHYFGGDGNDTFYIPPSTSPSAGDQFHGEGGIDTLEIAGAGSVNLGAFNLTGIEYLFTQGAVSLTVAQAAMFHSISAASLTLLDGGTVIFANAPYTVNLSNAGNTVDSSAANWNGTYFNGGNGADRIIASQFSDTLLGGGGNDTLIGNGGGDWFNGGAGLDTFYGGDTGDTYHVDSQSELIFENAGGGTDLVWSTASFYLYANIENLTLEEGSAASFGVGNALDNVIEANANANLLIGGGGNDTLSGRGGNDSLYGQDGNDILFGEDGIDYLVGGAGDDELQGMDGADALYGEDGADRLYGGFGFFTDILVGGGGDDLLYGISDEPNPDYDRMDGGQGDDVYWVDTGADLTFEAAGGGNDTVHADVTVPNAGAYLYANVENLVLEGQTAFGVGNGLDNRLTGSDSGNWLLGGAGADTIIGGLGNDVLFGEIGADVFVFGAGEGADLVGDFQTGEDRIQLNGIYADFAQVQAGFHQNGANGAIDLGNGNLIVLKGVNLSTLTAVDFLFASAAEPAASMPKPAPAMATAWPFVDPGIGIEWLKSAPEGWMAELHGSLTFA